MSKTFIDACLAGTARPEEIDDWVDAWHDAAPGSEDRTLDQYLGFTDEEGRLWARKPSSLWAILEDRKSARQRT